MAEAQHAGQQDLGLADVVDLVAAWLPDKTPLAATARFARCAVHFRSYRVASAASTEFRCFLCDCNFNCVVRRHHHVAPGFIVYEGEVHEGCEDVSYVWLPATDWVACQHCSEGLGFDPKDWREAEWRKHCFESELEEIADNILDMFLDSES